MAPLHRLPEADQIVYNEDIRRGLMTPKTGMSIARGLQKAPTKVAVSIRLSPDVVAHFKSMEPGWHTMIEDALRKCARLKTS